MSDVRARELAAVARDLAALAARVAELATCADAPGAEPVDGGPRKLLKVCEVVERLSLPKARIYSLAREGRIGGVVRIGRQLRFNPLELEVWIQSGGAGAAPQGANGGDA